MAASDAELLQRYVRENDQAAFADLVGRHLDWVFSAALRITRDAGAAEDVAQGVFLAVAQKAWRLAGHPQLIGWLFRATQYGATTVARRECRRKKVEGQGMSTIDFVANPKADRYWSEICDALEAAVGKLGREDRARRSCCGTIAN